MRVPSIVSSFLLLSGGALAGCQAKPTTSCSAVDASILANTGKPVGKESVYKDITMYTSKPDKHNPRTKAREDTAILVMTDVWGLALNENKLLVDSFARAGYLTIAPDLFDHNPAPGDINVPGFNTTEFLSRHEPAVTDPIIETTIEYLRKKLGVKHIVSAGYCFGGRYAFRFADAGRGVEVAYAAHPSLLESDEILAIDTPVSVAAADHDNLFTAELQNEMKALLVTVPQPYQMNLYSGTEHGFAVKGDMSDPEQKFAKEEAFLQAVKWFDHFLV